jgi:hypothetical protein
LAYLGIRIRFPVIAEGRAKLRLGLLFEVLAFEQAGRGLRAEDLTRIAALEQRSAASTFPTAQFLGADCSRFDEVE